jgi:hypothetical protein
MKGRWKQKWFWALVTAAVLVPGAAAVCYKNIVIPYRDGTQLHCSTFCIVDDSGWICVR